MNDRDVRTSVPPRRHTLLIVDDEPDVLESLRHLFHRHYNVVTADSGRDGLACLAREEVHVILSDQRMPGMTGDQFLKVARETHPDAIRLLFTGYAEIQTVISAVNEGGIFRYINKPWEAGELESVVAQAASQFDLLAERRRLVSELRETNAQLVEANTELAETDQLKTAFLEVASHEFNTPITIVQGLSGLLKLVNPDRDPQEQQIVDQISESSAQLAKLVATMLKLLRAGDFRNPLRLETTDLFALLNGVVSQAMPFVTARNLRFAIEVDEHLGDFELDPDKIRDAVVNLLSNAIKFTPDGGEVRLSASADEENAKIEVSDRGIGLEPRALAHLFEPFFTEFDPESHSSGAFGFRKRGLGLGLSLVKRFVELHGGTVQAESAPGEGTRVRLSLPRRQGSKRTPVVQSLSEARGPAATESATAETA